MKKAIITTTINKLTTAIREFCKIAQRQEWKFFIIGDQKTPHEEYEKLEASRVRHFLQVSRLHASGQSILILTGLKN